MMSGVKCANHMTPISKVKATVNMQLQRGLVVCTSDFHRQGAEFGALCSKHPLEQEEDTPRVTPMLCVLAIVRYQVLFVLLFVIHVCFDYGA